MGLGYAGGPARNEAGNIAHIFAATGAALVAVEISPDLLARARGRGLPPNVTLVEGDFHMTPFDTSFDAAIGSSVLHHLDLPRALSKIHAVLRPGGVVSFAEPNRLNPQVFLERTFRALPPFRSYVSPDETAFVRWRLARLLAQSGFQPIEIRPFDWLHPATPSSLIPFVSRAGAALERLPGVSDLPARCTSGRSGSDIPERPSRFVDLVE